MNLERIHIHIGAPKTGSTAIQRCLADHRVALAERGVRYPEVSLRGWGHHDVAFLLGGGYPEWASPQPMGLDALGEQLRGCVEPKDQVLVLSSEDFFLFPAPDALLRWLAHALGPLPPITIDVYLRPQFEALPSWYNQLVKAQGFGGTFEDSVTRDGHLWDYSTMLAPWAEAFGEDAIRVWAYPAGDIRSDYLTRIGAADAVCVPPVQRQNRRILRDILEYQRIVNKRTLPTATKRRFHKRLIELSHAEPRPPVLLDAPFVSASRLADLAAGYAESNANVAGRFGLQCPLFDPGAPAHEGKPQDYAGPSAAALALIGAWLESDTG
jgi:hypothetical protein